VNLNWVLGIFSPCAEENIAAATSLDLSIGLERDYLEF